MKKILIIEDSKSIASTLSLMIKEQFGYKTVLGSSVKECAKILLEHKGRFDVALLDLGLPDSTNGEIVDFVTKFNIPIIILTASISIEEDIKNRSLNIVDYVIKDGIYSFKYALSVIQRVINNKTIKVLVVDDSKSFLETIKKLLQRYRLTVFTAKNGKEALDVMNEHQDIKLLLTDYYMPLIDGLELVRVLRKKYNKDELSIIVTSGSKDKKTASKFLKYGANDFLYKGFTQEELFVRISANLELLELFEQLRKKANTDYLTNLYNRRYFFEQGKKILEFSKINNKICAVVLIDIDNFKIINDEYGHDIGDIAIKEVSIVLNRFLYNNELVARLGGEEFSILFYNCEEKETLDKLELIREEFEKNVIDLGTINIKFTVSIGCSFNNSNGSIEAMLQEADKNLYKAKDSGRNQIRYKK
ncbi:REC domain-containing diguanylate cyclase [Malaciobacter molluscorum LMG 25693]|uniref:diguanylate cyclase n=1 Tax=Malaciobacter molluscorum LMG 25693 TaxID=870501 RepID=A0A2G1DEZ1_9BACT|nr:diguanylate cyclase [Malaciobacter molluscorum]AXX93274.1 response regulator receiver-modulated diguanylate cyclase [Malaciobacter molluscorum LMG 25693]PHO17059.1 REC domain-containing diguanylate cyclase [Malaciobacter molluscorum LMG 25693]